MAGIHPTAVIEPGAKVSEHATIGPFSILRDGVIVDDAVEIGSHCDLGLPSGAATGPLRFGSGSLVRSHSRFYLGSDFSGGITTGHSVTVRENTRCGPRFQLGTLSDVEGDCDIGTDVRTHNNVLISKNSVIGNYVWLSPFVHLTDDPHPPSETRLGVTIGDFAMVAARTTILPGVRLGSGVLIGAGSIVRDDVPDGMIAAGVPAELRGKVTRIKMRDGSGLPAYPWMRHFHRGYPAEVVAEWLQIYGADRMSEDQKG